MVIERTGRRDGALRRLLLGTFLVVAVVIGLVTLHTHSLHPAPPGHSSSAQHHQSGGATSDGERAAGAGVHHGPGVTLAAAVTCLVIAGLAFVDALTKPNGRAVPPCLSRAVPRVVPLAVPPARGPSLHVLCISRT